jgi:hypothetical protein
LRRLTEPTVAALVAALAALAAFPSYKFLLQPILPRCGETYAFVPLIRAIECLLEQIEPCLGVLEGARGEGGLDWGWVPWQLHLYVDL